MNIPNHTYKIVMENGDYNKLKASRSPEDFLVFSMRQAILESVNAILNQASIEILRDFFYIAREARAFVEDEKMIDKIKEVADMMEQNIKTSASNSKAEDDIIKSLTRILSQM